MAIPEEEILLAAIRDRPHDDRALLEYADWLERRGDPRSELVLRKRWTVEGDPPDRLVAMAGDFLELPDVFAAVAPAATIRLMYARELWAELAQCAALARLTGLDLRGNCVFKEFLASPYLGGLRYLNLSDTCLRDDDMWWFVEMETLYGLRELDLSCNRIDDEGMDVLVVEWPFRHLVRLNLDENAFGGGAYGWCGFPAGGTPEEWVAFVQEEHRKYWQASKSSRRRLGERISAWQYSRLLHSQPARRTHHGRKKPRGRREEE